MYEFSRYSVGESRRQRLTRYLYTLYRITFYSLTIKPRKIMKTNVISNFRDYATVTHPIEADDLKTPKVYQYSPARYIVTDYNQEQRADLLEMTHGRETADGIVFAASKWVRDRLHSWQNYEAHKQRAAILGDGWQYISGLRHGTQPGDVVCCVPIS